MKQLSLAGVMSVMNPEQLGTLIDRHSAALVLFAQQWCAAAEDVVQEAFLKLAAQKQAPASPAAWLYRTVRNGAINQARSDRRRHSHEKRAARSAEFGEPAATDGLDPEQVESAIGALPIEQREVIVAHLWGGLSFAQISGISGESAATVWRRYNAGLEILRQKLGMPCPKT